MDISFDNVFLASMKVIDEEVLRIIVAQDKIDASKTLLDYYNEPEVLYIINFTSLKQMYEKIQLEKNYYLIIELNVKENDKKENVMEYILHEEIFDNEIKLKEKYNNLHCFILNANNIEQLCSKAALEFKNPTQPPLISENINL